MRAVHCPTRWRLSDTSGAAHLRRASKHCCKLPQQPAVLLPCIPCCNWNHTCSRRPSEDDRGISAAAVSSVLASGTLGYATCAPVRRSGGRNGRMMFPDANHSEVMLARLHGRHGLRDGSDSRRRGAREARRQCSGDVRRGQVSGCTYRRSCRGQDDGKRVHDGQRHSRCVHYRRLGVALGRGEGTNGQGAWSGWAVPTRGNRRWRMPREWNAHARLDRATLRAGLCAARVPGASPCDLCTRGLSCTAVAVAEREAASCCCYDGLVVEE